MPEEIRGDCRLQNRACPVPGLSLVCSRTCRAVVSPGHYCSGVGVSRYCTVPDRRSEKNGQPATLSNHPQALYALLRALQAPWEPLAGHWQAPVRSARATPVGHAASQHRQPADTVGFPVQHPSGVLVTGSSYTTSPASTKFFLFTGSTTPLEISDGPLPTSPPAPEGGAPGLPGVPVLGWHLPVRTARGNRGCRVPGRRRGVLLVRLPAPPQAAAPETEGVAAGCGTRPVDACDFPQVTAAALNGGPVA